MKKIPLMLCGISLAAGLTYSLSAQAESMGYLISVHTLDQAQAGTNHTVYATIYGSRGTSGRLSLDKAGSDDFKRGEWRYYTFGTNLPVGKGYVRDVGWPTKIKLTVDSEDGNDGGDVCIDQLSVNYLRNGKALAGTPYLKSTDGKRDIKSCLGDNKAWADDAGGAQWERTYFANTPVPDRLAKIAGLNSPLRRGKQYEAICGAYSEKCELSRTETFGMSNNVTEGWSEQTQASLEHAISTTVSSSTEVDGGVSKAKIETSLSRSFRQSFSTSSGKSGQKSSDVRKEISSTLTCSPPQNKPVTVWQLQYSTPFGSEEVTYRTCFWYCGDKPPAPSLSVTEAGKTCK